MNPLAAPEGDALLHIAAEPADIVCAQGRGISGSEHQYGNSCNRFGIAHLADGCRDSLYVALHPLVEVGARPLCCNDGPDLARHLVQFSGNASKNIPSTIPARMRQPTSKAP